MDSFSPETTVNTDMTVTTSAESEIQRTETQTDIRNEKKLLHDVQLLKMQLTQKELVIEGIKADFLSRIEDLEEKLADVVYQKQLLQLRLEAQLQFVETSSKAKESALKDEIQKLKAKHPKGVDEAIWKLIRIIRENLSDPTLYDGHFKYLREKTQEDMTAEDHLMILIYEKIFTSNELKITRKQSVTRLQDDSGKKLSVNKGNNIQHQTEEANYDAQINKFSEKILVQKMEEIQGLKKKMTALHKENCEMQEELMKWRMLCEETEDSVAQLQLELQSSQQVKEELLNKLTDIRKKYRQTYASTFRQEVDSIKIQLQQDIGQLRQELEQAAAEKTTFESWKRKAIKQISQLQNDLRETRRTKNEFEEQLEERKRDCSQFATLHRDATNELEQQFFENRRIRMKLEVLKREVENLHSEHLPVREKQEKGETAKCAMTKPAESSANKESVEINKLLGQMSSELTHLKSEHAKLQERHLELIADMNVVLANRKAMEKINDRVTTLQNQLVGGRIQASNVPEWLSLTKPEGT